MKYPKKKLIFLRTMKAKWYLLDEVVAIYAGNRSVKDSPVPVLWRSDDGKRFLPV